MSRPESELAHLFRQLKAPAAARALPKLADRARSEEWSYEHFAATLLKTETDSRDSHGGQARIKAARFPARKTLEEFDFAFQTSVPRNAVLHLGQLDFLHGRENVVLLGPPGTGKTHLSIALGIRACLAGHRVAFRTATEWVALLADAQRQGRLDDELDRLQRIPLLIVDEVGYIPFDPHAANLMFMLISRRYERASMIVTSNKPFSAWGEIFGDEITAAAMIDRLGPPRRDPRPQRRQLPPQRPRPRTHPPGRLNRTLTPCGASPDRLRRPGINIQINQNEVHFSTGASGPHFNRP
jgi:DNA replication protein DnaC